MAINYNYSIEEKELLHQIDEVRELLRREMEERRKLEIDVKFIEARINNIAEIYPPIGRLMNEKQSPLMDIIISLVAKGHRDGLEVISFDKLYNQIRSSYLYNDKPDSAKNDIETAIHTSLDSLEYKGFIVSINRGQSRLIQLSELIKRPFRL